jgi:peptidyl-prolyl cis-trans isomerase C
MNPFPASRIPASSAPAARLAAWRRCAAVPFCAAFLAATGSSFAQSPAQNPSQTTDSSLRQISSPAQDPVIARVGDTEIRESDLRLAEEGIGSQIPPQEGVNRREYLLAFLSDMARLSKAAQMRNVGDEAEIRRRMEFTRSKALMDTLLEVTARNAASEEAVRKTYDEYVAKNPPEPELHMRAIVFKFPSPDDQAAVAAAEAKAKEAIGRIAGGESFAAVAAKMSDVPDAKIDSGDLGYLTRKQMGKEYAEVAFALPRGEASGLIKTAFGWHIIRVEDERIRKPAEFEQLRPSFVAYVSRNAQLQLLAQLRQAAPLERLDQAAAEAPEPGK